MEKPKTVKLTSGDRAFYIGVNTFLVIIGIAIAVPIIIGAEIMIAILETMISNILLTSASYLFIDTVWKVTTGYVPMLLTKENDFLRLNVSTITRLVTPISMQISIYFCSSLTSISRFCKK